VGCGLFGEVLVMVSKTNAGFMLIGGIAMVIVCGQVASYAGNKVGSLSDDFYYDCIGWAGTLGAIAGLALFFWGAKIFAAKGA
jgi:hypothetical protein